MLCAKVASKTSIFRDLLLHLEKQFRMVVPIGVTTLLLLAPTQLLLPLASLEATQGITLEETTLWRSAAYDTELVA